MEPPEEPAPDLATAAKESWTVTTGDLLSMAPLSGVSVCVAPEKQVCAVTDTKGMAKLEVPSPVTFMLSYTLAGYPPQLTEHTSSSQPTMAMNIYPLISNTAQALLLSSVGKQQDAAKGSLVVSFLDAKHVALAGASYTVAPAVGDGAYYFDSQQGLPDPSAKQTGANGIGFHLNVPAGDYEISPAKMGLGCHPWTLLAWQGSSPSTARARVVAGSSTTISIICE